jgi:hypothetical protein
MVASFLFAWLAETGLHMADAARLRDRATRVLALARKARDEGNEGYAEELTQLAVEAFDQATEIETLQSKLKLNVRARSRQPALLGH